VNAHGRVGRRFQGRFGSVPIDAAHCTRRRCTLLAISRARLVVRPDEWRWAPPAATRADLIRWTAKVSGIFTILMWPTVTDHLIS
jgi:hypothetical protein